VTIGAIGEVGAVAELPPHAAAKTAASRHDEARLMGERL
jgi:hypothetical protein